MNTIEPEEISNIRTIPFEERDEQIESAKGEWFIEQLNSEDGGEYIIKKIRNNIYIIKGLEFLNIIKPL